MRVTVFASRKAPKFVIYDALDQLHGEHGLSIIAWLDNNGGAAAVDWAGSRPGAEVTVVESVKSPSSARMGQYFDYRAAIITCFKLYQPDRALVFSQFSWLTHSVGHRIVQNAEKWSVPLWLYEPDEHGNFRKETTCREMALCHKQSPIKKNICTRMKGHPTALHWSYVKGKRKGEFWLP